MSEDFDRICDAAERWRVENQPPAQEMERITREAASRHDDWDGLHFFNLYEWDGLQVEAALIAGIDPAIDATDYPETLFTLVADFMSTRERNKPPIVACLLQIEAFTLDAHEDEWTPEMQLARETRQIHTLPQSVEQCVVLTCDMAGRSWLASKDRLGGRELFRGPEDDVVLSGQMQKAVRTCAFALPFAYVAVDR
jgi:hypothetical protein